MHSGLRSVVLEHLGFDSLREPIGAIDTTPAYPFSPTVNGRRLALLVASVGMGPGATLQTLYNPSTALAEVQRTPTTWKSFRGTGVHQANTVWTPAAGKKFRILAFRMGISGNAIKAVAEVVEFNLLDGGVAIFAGGLSGWSVFIPAAAPANPLGVLWETGWINLPENGYLSTAANNVFAAQGNGAAALTAGFFGVMVAGTEE